MNFKKGNLVKWTSEAQGCRKTKVGGIVAVIPPNTEVNEVLAVEELDLIKLPGSPRIETSYVVLVPKHDNRGKNLTGKIYWPLTNHLKLVY
jgi:hypothetical protein